MAVKTANMRQLDTARSKMNQLISDAQNVWAEGRHEPSWEENSEWERKHPSPMVRFKREREKAMKSLIAKRDSIIFDARMGKITADELYEAVRSFK